MLQREREFIGKNLQPDKKIIDGQRRRDVKEAICQTIINPFSQTVIEGEEVMRKRSPPLGEGKRKKEEREGSRR